MKYIKAKFVSPRFGISFFTTPEFRNHVHYEHPDLDRILSVDAAGQPLMTVEEQKGHSPTIEEASQEAREVAREEAREVAREEEKGGQEMTASKESPGVGLEQ